jgi:tetrahydromethanopterin S-methyltransferase subunit F
MRCGRYQPMSGLTTNEIAGFLIIALLLALVLVFLFR